MDWTTGKLAEGLQHYNAGEFFEAHESWETAWLEATGSEKTLLQGVIQVAAAFHHYGRENRLGTKLLLQAALQRLESGLVQYPGISVTLLCADIRECLRVLDASGSQSRLSSPRIVPHRAEMPLNSNSN